MAEKTWIATVQEADTKARYIKDGYEKSLDHMTKIFKAAWKSYNYREEEAGRDAITYEDWVFRNEYFAWMDARLRQASHILRWHPFNQIGHWAALDEDGDLILAPMNRNGTMEQDNEVEPDWGRLTLEEVTELRLIQRSLKYWAQMY